MSIDDSLRHAFGSTDTEWERAAPAALRAVTTRRHRERLLVRGGAAALAAAAAVAVVAMVGTGRGDHAAPAPVGPPTTPTQVDEPPPTSSPSVLQGRWRTRLLDENDLRAALEQSGDGQFTERILPTLQPAPFRLVWLVTYETAELRLVSGKETLALDKVTLAVDGDRVTVAPRFAEGASVHRFAVSGDELRLTFVSTTEGTVDGVPGDVWQRLLYDAFGFVRH